MLSPISILTAFSALTATCHSFYKYNECSYDKGKTEVVICVDLKNDLNSINGENFNYDDYKYARYAAHQADDCKLEYIQEKSCEYEALVSFAEVFTGLELLGLAAIGVNHAYDFINDYVA